MGHFDVEIIKAMSYRKTIRERQQLFQSEKVEYSDEETGED